MPFKSKAQIKAIAAKEHAGELPKGTFDKWKAHTPNMKALPSRVTKKAYDLGVARALIDFGVVKIAVDIEKKEGKETRLKRNHQPFDFYGVKKNFKRAGPHKKEVGTHVTHTKECK